MRYVQAFFLLFLLLPGFVAAQDNRLVNTDDWSYEYIKRLQQRGYLLGLNPTLLPYKEQEIRHALQEVDAEQLSDTERHWYRELSSAFEEQGPNVEDMHLGGLFEAGAWRSSSRRLNVLQPSGDPEPLLPYARLNGYLERDRWIGQAGVTFSYFYQTDPDGLDLARRLYTRSEEAYLGYNGDILEVYAGRFDNHWSVYDRQGAFLTDNPRSFDQLQLRFGGSKLYIKSIIGELDNMGEDGRFTGHDFELGSYRRYLFLHRLEWSPVSNLKLSFIEGELYFSETAGLSLRNLMPLHFMFFESHTEPVNNNSNLLIGGSVWYQRDNLTLFVQGMLDDLVVERRGELREENRLIPTVYTVNSSLVLSGLADRFDAGLEADFVSANSYRSHRYQDQWTYAQRGLATEFSDYIRTRAYLTYYPEQVTGLKLEPALTFYYKGVGDYRELRTSTNPDGSQIPGILSGTVERTVRPSLYLRYQPLGSSLFGADHDMRLNFWLEGDMGVNFVKNAGNTEGATDRRFNGLFRIHAQVSF